MRLLQAQVRRLLQPLWPQRRQVDRGAQGEQALVGADITGCFLAADVLLARLQGQYPASFAGAVHGLPDDATRDLTNELLLARHHAQVWTAVRHRIAEHLPFADGDVRAVLAGSFQEAEADAVETNDEQGAAIFA